jgi:predicted alpha/beta superfamily hydrolase
MMDFARISRIAAVLGLALAVALPVAATASPARVVSQGPALQFAATQYVVHSERVGRDFLVKVSPPFAPVPSGQKRPVIYALDGGYEIAGPMGWVLGGAGGMAQAYIVSVGYLPSDFARRDGDLAHHPYADAGRNKHAGGAAFEAFLLDELRPLIEASYPIDADQAFLFGHSEGGLFAANVLAERPAAFRGYLIASPSIWMDPSIVNRVAAATKAGEGRRVYVAVGGAETPEMLDGERQLVAALTGQSSRLNVTSRVYEGGTHLSYYPMLVATAFPWLLPAAGPGT